MPEMKSFRNEQISGIVEWMEKSDTHPHLLLMLIAALTGELSQLSNQECTWWRTMKKSFMIIPQMLILQGFLPKGLDQIQQDYYISNGSHRTGAKWLRKLCGKLIDVTHALWRKRNFFEHDKRQHGLHKIEDLRLEEAVKHQYSLGTES